MNVSLTPEYERFVKQEVDAGRYQTASEVIHEGLRLLLERQRVFDELNDKTDRALEDVAAGRTYNPEEARAMLRARRAARAESSS